MRFLVVLSAVAAAFAQVTINTPLGVLACTNTQVTWSGGTPPYILQIQPGGDVSAAALETFTGLTGTSYEWHVIEPANTQVFLRLRDSTGVPAETATFTIQSAGAGVTCSSSSVSGSTDTTVNTSTGAAAPPPASSSTPAAVGGTTTTPAPSGSSSGSSSSHSSSSTTKTGGASAAHVAGGLVGLVGAVAVALA